MTISGVTAPNWDQPADSTIANFVGFWIRATNNDGEHSDFSGPGPGRGNFYARAALISEIGAPSSPPTLVRTAGSITVSWGAPSASDYWTLDNAEADGSARDGWPYFIERQARNTDGVWGSYGFTGTGTWAADGWRRYDPATTITSPYTDNTAIREDHAYRYRLRYNSNCAILGEWSEESDAAEPVTETTSVPDAPTLDDNASMGFTSAKLTIRQNADGGETITAINVYYRNTDRISYPGWTASNLDKQVFTPSSSNIYTVTDLKSDSTYEFRVKAENSNGESAYSDAIEGKTPVNTAPDNIAASGITTSAVTLEWDAVEGAVGYHVQYREGSLGAWTRYPDEITGLTITLSGLTPGTLHQVQVRTDFGESVQSEWSTPSIEATTEALLDTAPTSAPTAVMASSAGETSIAISWTAVPDTDAGVGATAIDEYNVEGARTQDFADVIWEEDATLVTITHTGLSPGNLWYYRIRAVNDEGIAGRVVRSGISPD